MAQAQYLHPPAQQAKALAPAAPPRVALRHFTLLKQPLSSSSCRGNRNPLVGRRRRRRRLPSGRHYHRIATGKRGTPALSHLGKRSESVLAAGRQVGAAKSRLWGESDYGCGQILEAVLVPYYGCGLVACRPVLLSCPPAGVRRPGRLSAAAQLVFDTRVS